MIDAFRRASARRITVVLPYYGYARQDKKVKPREPVNGTSDRGPHHTRRCEPGAVPGPATRARFQGFLRSPVDHLYAGPLIADYLIQEGLYNGNTVVVSPDVGGVSRARALAEHLKSPIAIIAKRRPEPNTVEIMEIHWRLRARCA